MSDNVPTHKYAANYDKFINFYGIKENEVGLSVNLVGEAYSFIEFVFYNDLFGQPLEQLRVLYKLSKE